MGITISWSELGRSTRRARKAAENGPVFITERGVIAFALMTIEEYIRVGGSVESESPHVESGSSGETE